MIELKEDSSTAPKHYYGDVIRILHLIAGCLMLVTLPFFLHHIPLPFYGSIFLIMVIGIFAGFTNPKILWSGIFDFSLSLIAFCTFEYFAIQTYLEKSWTDLFFWENEILAVLFFLAFYFAIKTIRGFLIERNT